MVDRPNPRPVWICVWAARVRWRRPSGRCRGKTRSPAQLEHFLGKLRLYLVVKQDSTTDWLLDHFPSLFVILSEKNYMGMFCQMIGSDPKLADLAWINGHIRQGHGPLGAVYPTSGWNPKYPGQQEGDTPSCAASGQRGAPAEQPPEKPEQAGWGGKLTHETPSKNHWFDDPAGTKTVSRWRAEVQADFVRRADWMLP